MRKAINLFMDMFTAKDLVSGKMVKIDNIEFNDGEIRCVNIIDIDGTIEPRAFGDDLEIYLNGKKL